MKKFTIQLLYAIILISLPSAMALAQVETQELEEKRLYTYKLSIRSISDNVYSKIHFSTDIFIGESDDGTFRTCHGDICGHARSLGNRGLLEEWPGNHVVGDKDFVIEFDAPITDLSIITFKKGFFFDSLVSQGENGLNVCHVNLETKHCGSVVVSLELIPNFNVKDSFKVLNVMNFF